MTVTQNESGLASELPASSLKERLAKRRKELESEANFELPVPGYDGLWARYRVLGYEEIRGIGLRIEEEAADQTSAERLTAAETLAEACIELLEHVGADDRGKPVFESLGKRWSAATVNEFFGASLPDGVIARDAVLAVFPYPRDMLMMSHFQEYMEEGMKYLPEIEQAMQGESRAASAAT